MRLADKVFNTRGRSIKVGTSYGSVSQLRNLGSYIHVVILLNDKSLEESIRPSLIIPWTLADSRSHEALVARSVEQSTTVTLSRDVKTLLGVEQKESSKAVDAL